MSSRYEHLTKISSRILERLNPPKSMKQRSEKLRKLSLPEFLSVGVSPVEKSEMYKTEKDWKFLPGDRVVLLKGSKKGSICYIKSQERSSNGYILDDNGPSKSVPIPKEFWVAGQKSHMLNVPVPVKQSEIKLVADIDDPANPGATKTVAVRDVVFKGNYYDENYKKVLPYRQVSGMPDLIIPWPKPEASKTNSSLGTSPEVAREQTFWVDSIVKNTIPVNAFLTIRNPYSKYRRGTLTSKDIARLVAPKMPLTESKKEYIRDRQKLSQIRRPKLTDAEKEQIGETILKHISS
ncbi:hypothetical protein TPHA_0D01460 [Tetrapisispora phaffii CBS 4417]|uniref:KOW domain-containing protein n=1 Tax=Tetrapisispora phaffii (strain ATCC 24235 / CBS 4417 / NBRC 1672 / NRRL Y-8282 / UCD 70-5) TaxID=1071381 RepID=G8BSG5_TETPH|nr:mitochondrial 54S ribosomal protein YmL40 TPHA_0D01460 [Tetrapisispora phaffii CBS 4417]CCE62786.1 hypothetical protein TPHA_0D01460 [Tetrapisispora phaffii CBS 4417]